MSEAEGAGTGEVDEQRIGRLLAIGLPTATVLGAIVVGVVVGPATSILVVAAGGLLGVIAILWGSLRILSGDAVLSPDLAELDTRAEGVDALANRKKMLLRSLKDLEGERAIGKMEADDYQQLSAIYRADLKIVLQKIDASLAPRRSLAEEAAREHLLNSRVFAENVGRAPQRPPKEETQRPAGEAKMERAKPARVACPICHAKNEHDAKFCKECAAKLARVSEPPSKDETAEAGDA